MTETARTPQTFEEWRERWPLLYDDTRAAYAAGVASQQAEIERLNTQLDEMAMTFGNQGNRLARYEAVVEAAREVDDLAPTLRAFIDDPLFHQACTVLHDRLAALDEKPAK